MALEFVKVRIVDESVDFLAGAPRERGVTVCTPHLIAACDLENELCAPRTLPRVLFEQFHGFFRVFVADVLVILNCVAFRARDLLAYVAFPRV